MPGITNKPRALLPGLLVVAGCIGSFSPVSRAPTPLAPNDAEAGVETAFHAYGIPVTEHARNGRVQSGPFDPYEAFGALMTDRVVCGFRPDDPSVSSVRGVRLEVIATIRSNRQAGTRVEIESYGRGRVEAGTEVSCRLSSSAVEELLASIARHGATGGFRVGSTGSGAR